MRLGIRKLEYIDSAHLHDFSQLPAGSSLKISNFIKAGHSFSQLPFTPETGELDEKWSDDDGGQMSRVSFNAAIRQNKDAYKSTLQALVGRKCIWKLSLTSGVEYIIGSKEYVPKFTYGDGVSGQSSSEFSISIENESLHGLLVNVAD